MIELEKLEAAVSRIAFGVTFTTVAVVISGVIANRISDKKLERQFKELKNEKDKKDKKDEKDEKEERDLVSIPILFIAAVLCILGLFLPYILTLYGI